MRFQPPPGYQAIYNPIVPYSGPIYGGLKLGMSLSIQGTVHNDAKSFKVILLSWQGGHADIALFFNPRLYDGNVVVMNSKVAGNWKSEERPSEMPFQKGESFQLLFIVTFEGYQIKVNGRDFHLFKHRMPVEGVSILSIKEDVSVHIINIIGGGIGHMMGYPGSGQEVVIPYVAPIYGGLRPGMSLHIWGAVPCDVTRFHVSLQTSEAKCSDKALYINPRFKPAEYVVFSSFKNAIFEDQERVTNSPLSPGQKFQLVIVVTKECYQVNINDQAYTFKHRMPLARVLALGIGGDVFVESVNIMGEGQRVMTRPGPGYVGVNSYTQPIPGGLKEGMSLYFRGTIRSEDINSFRIILKGGGDLALYFNPQFGGWSGVVFNTLDNGKWQAEERVNEMPFLKGKNFELVFVVTSEGYEVSVDGRDIHMYKHRVPLEQVTDLVIEGEVSVQTINIIPGPDEEVKPENPENEQGVIQEYPAPGDVSSSTYSQSIDGGLVPGMSLYFEGTAHSDSNSFAINLYAGDDLAMHFSPRFREGETLVVFNTRENGRWQSEERPSEMPFSDGADFQLVFNVTSECYQVIVNGSVFYMYKHRIAVDRVNSLDIRGDVSVRSIIIKQDEEVKPENPEDEQGVIQEYQAPGDVSSSTYSQSIDGGLVPGMSLYFEGTAHSDSSSFAINLYAGDDLAMHFSPRFREGETVVVFNTRENGRWQSEEKPSEMPFSVRADFQLVLNVTSECYQVIVNASVFYMYKHRIPVDRVNSLEIRGDVSVRSIIIKQDEEVKAEKPEDEQVVIQEYPAPGDVSSSTYSQSIDGGLVPGMSLYFEGTAHSDSNRFVINLYAGDDLAMHFSARFREGETVVVFNTRENGRWQSEERPSEMPFSDGADFQLVFNVTSECYQVIVNASMFYMYKHRIPVDRVNSLEIRGDVSVWSIIIKQDEEVKAEKPEHEQGVIQEYPAPGDVSSSTYSQSINGGLVPGMSLYFEGTAHSDSNSFAINLYAGDDLAMHFSARFREGETLVVFNTRENGRWQSEEKPSEMPFSVGADFQLVFNVTSEGYQVIVNGSVFYMYKHRIPVDRVNSLEIRGDVSVRSIILNREQGLIQEYPAPGDVKSDTYEQPIEGGLKTGMMLYFRGTVPSENVNSFAINLVAGGDLAMFFKPRFSRWKEVVFNSRENGKWQSEVRPSEMPFSEGSTFDLLFNVTLKGYQVIVDGRVLHMYKHRIPVDRVTALSIIGDVFVESLVIIKDSAGSGGSGYNWRFLPMMGTEPIYSPPVPYTRMIPGGMIPKKTIAISGRVLPDADRIAFNFNVSSSGDLAFHFNPRMNEGSVVRNSCLGGNWGREERDVKFNPFQKGQYFEILIRCGRLQFMVFGNGKHMFNFYHRFQPFTKIDTLHIRGDVQLSYLLM